MKLSFLCHPNKLHKALVLVTKTNRLAGLRMFEDGQERSRPVLSILYASVLLTIYCGGMYFQQRYYAGSKLLILEYVLYEFIMYVNIGSVIYSSLLGMYHTKTFKKYVRRIDDVDDTLRQLGSSLNYRAPYFVSLTALTLWALFISVMTYMNARWLTVKMNVFIGVILTMAYNYSLSIGTIVILDYTVCVRYVYQIKKDLMIRGKLCCI